MIFRRPLPFCKCLLHDHVDRASIFRVHAHHAAILRRSLQSLEDAAIVEHENSGISHEQLEAGHAFVNQIVHLRELSAGNVGHNAVKCIIADGFVGGLTHPCVESLAQGLTFVLNGEVDERGRATEGSGSRPRFEIVRAGRASKWHVEMRMYVNASGQHEFSRRIQHMRGILRWQIFADGSDLSIGNGNVCQIRISCGHDGTISNDRVEAHQCLHWRNE